MKKGKKNDPYRQFGEKRVKVDKKPKREKISVRDYRWCEMTTKVEMTTKELFRLFSRSYAVAVNDDLCYISWYDVGESAKEEQSVSVCGSYFKESDVEKIDISDDEVIVKLHNKKSLLYFKFLERISIWNHFEIWLPYGVTVAQEFLVLLVEVQILVG